MAEILSILREIPLGKYKIAAGLQLRNSMFLNGILTNFEVRYGLKLTEIRELEKIDEYLMKNIVGTFSKAPIQGLYLETSALKIRYVIMTRRLNYLHHILSVKPDELISRVYRAQMRRPGKDDWCLSVKQDLLETSIDLDDEAIKGMKKKVFKELVKKKVRLLAFDNMKKLMENNSKGNEIVYRQFDIQSYLRSEKSVS